METSSIAVNDEKHCRYVTQVTITRNMSYSTFLETLKIEHEAWLSVKDEVELKVPKINDKGNYRKIIG